MPWIILILVMPVLGVCLYLMFQTNKGTRNMAQALSGNRCHFAAMPAAQS